MPSPKPTFWGPYANEGEARQCLGAFAAEIVGPGTGVIFCDGIGAEYLRRPFYDSDGSGLVLIASCRAELPPPAPPPAPHGAWQRIEKFFNDAMTSYGQSQLEASKAQLAMGQAEADMLKKGWTSLHDFVEGHKMAFDGVAVAGDVFGVIAGAVAILAIGATGFAVLPVLGVIAGVASLALLAEDGSVLYAELRNDEVRKKEIEESWHYKVIELVGPLLLLPDLVFGGPRAVASLPKSAAELGETTEAVAHGSESLSAQRGAVDAYKESHASKLGRSNIQTKVQRMQARANKLARDLKAAQQRLSDAQREFKILRVIEMPAYAGSAYTSGMYMVEPPDCLKDLVQCTPHGGSYDLRAATHLQNPAGMHDSASSPMHLLVPQRSGHQAPQASVHLSFQVAVSQNPAAAKR